ncbi:MAG: hypothetical protein KAG66_08220, partial [Methylococcales bacterium]|nr:hypothetical protein [Methylococcales bacterium]
QMPPIQFRLIHGWWNKRTHGHGFGAATTSSVNGQWVVMQENVNGYPSWDDRCELVEGAAKRNLARCNTYIFIK